MKPETGDFYVYVYIDPRNYEEFYYGKGRGSRSQSHFRDKGDNVKTTRIRAIEAVGERPIIRVVAAGLSEHDALLIESTLIWRLGRLHLANKASGHSAAKFRPPNTLHRRLAGYDFANGIYYVNVGEGRNRNWDDCRRFGFMSAGQGVRWSRQIRQLDRGDVVVAYLRRHGYVGVGFVTASAVPVREFKVAGKSGRQRLPRARLACPGIFEHSDDDSLSEHLIQVKWVVHKPREEAAWRNRYGLYTTQHVKASLANQQRTIRFIEGEWGVDFERLMESAETPAGT